ncbi:hypothetical protein BVRB_5g115580 [Beta vulgaris subsp. vulgaris]|nr:hypothetical protein BVRB_5g115580 [Beta vulgaris subsp. vulgaris]
MKQEATHSFNFNHTHPEEHRSLIISSTTTDYISERKMCLRVDPFDSEGDDIELALPGGLLDRLTNAFSDFELPSSSSCVTTSASESSSKYHQQFYMGMHN